MRYKSNKNINVIKDNKKSYVFIYEKKKQIGMLMWHYTKKKWVYKEQKVKNG